MEIPAVIIGLITSVVTEILKLFPVISATKNRKRITAMLVAFVLSAIYLFTSEPVESAGEITTFLGLALVTAFGIYKSLFQPIVKGLKGETQ